MAHGGARVGSVEAAIDDPVKRHGTGPRANHRGNNEAEGAPAGPAALIARGYNHRGKREGKSENGMGEFDEFGPGAEVRKHRRSERFPPVEARVPPHPDPLPEGEGERYVHRTSQESHIA